MSEHKVFVNRILNLKQIKFIGVDMDHTLIRYNSERFEDLVFQLVKQQLVESGAYPAEVQDLEFHFDDAIRGLVIDTQHGNILKLSRYGAIRLSHHGTKPIDFSQQKKIYRTIYVDLGDPNYMVIDTSFSIAFCILYAQLVDIKDKYPDKMPSYQNIAREVQFYVDKVHSDGSLKGILSQNLAEYVIKDQELIAGIKHFIHFGKKLFILTNSDFHYTKLLLDYAINPFLAKGETWQDLFVYVITLANKPRFFYDNARFLTVDRETGAMSNTLGKIQPGVYQGGNAKKFTEDLAISGDEILYIGDHIYGDILRLKKDCNWRTALVVEELGKEIAAQRMAQPVENKIVQAMHIKKNLEQKYLDLCTRSVDEGSKQYNNQIEELYNEIAVLDGQLAKLIQEQSRYYNLKWERVFRAGAEESYFAHQVDRFACIYMEKLTDLFEQSPLTYFRANRRLLAHDMEN